MEENGIYSDAHGDCCELICKLFRNELTKKFDRKIQLPRGYLINSSSRLRIHSNNNECKNNNSIHKPCLLFLWPYVRLRGSRERNQKCDVPGRFQFQMVKRGALDQYSRLPSLQCAYLSTSNLNKIC